MHTTPTRPTTPRTIGWQLDGTPTCNDCAAAHYGTTPHGIINAVTRHLDRVRRVAAPHLPLALARIPRPITTHHTSHRPACSHCRTPLH